MGKIDANISMFEFRIWIVNYTNNFLLILFLFEGQLFLVIIVW